jgi:CBS domain-containing protein
VLALSLGLRETNTLDRLEAVGTRGALAASEVSDLREAYAVLGRLRLRHQLDCVDRGTPPDNHLDPRALGRTDRLLLREAFRAVARLQTAVETRFQTAAVT